MTFVDVFAHPRTLRRKRRGIQPQANELPRRKQRGINRLQPLLNHAANYGELNPRTRLKIYHIKAHFEEGTGDVPQPHHTGIESMVGRRTGYYQRGSEISQYRFGRPSAIHKRLTNANILLGKKRSLLPPHNLPALRRSCRCYM
jgi:hypothetical protein